MLSIEQYNMFKVIESHQRVYRTIEYRSDKTLKVIQSHDVVYWTIEYRSDKTFNVIESQIPSQPIFALSS